MKNKKTRNREKKADTAGERRQALSEQTRKSIEGCATFGLILVAVALAAPFTNLTDYEYVRIFKWIYAPGALIFTIARICGSKDPADSMRVRRLRRVECWAGIALCVGAFFWFYNEELYGSLLENNSGVLTVLQNTIMFSLIGALLQVVASWMIYYRQKKDNNKSVSDS